MGSRFSISIAIPVIVFITAKPSVPDSMQHFAFSAMSVWLGDNFVIKGFFVALRQASTTFADIIGSFPNSTPPFLIFGQEILISIAFIGESSNIRVISSYSSIVEPDKFAIKHVSSKSRCGKYSSTTTFEPGFCKPIAFNMPK